MRRSGIHEKIGIYLKALWFLTTSGSSNQVKSANEIKIIPECKNANVHYHVWVGDNVEDSYSKNVKVEDGSKFFEVMTEAAEDDERFEFTYTTYTFGRFINSIGGVEQTSWVLFLFSQLFSPKNFLLKRSQFWMVYVLKSKPNTHNKPGSDKLSNVGVDDLVVQDGKHYLFWLTSGSQ